MLGVWNGLERVASLVTLLYTSKEMSVLMCAWYRFFYFVGIVFIRLSDLRKTKFKDGALEKMLTISSNFFDKKLYKKCIILDPGAYALDSLNNKFLFLNFYSYYHIIKIVEKKTSLEYNFDRYWNLSLCEFVKLVKILTIWRNHCVYWNIVTSSCTKDKMFM